MSFGGAFFRPTSLVWAGVAVFVGMYLVYVDIKRPRPTLSVERLSEEFARPFRAAGVEAAKPWPVRGLRGGTSLATRVDPVKWDGDARDRFVVELERNGWVLVAGNGANLWCKRPLSLRMEVVCDGCPPVYFLISDVNPGTPECWK